MATKEKGNRIWTWLRDEANRKVIAWFGSGIVAVAGGLWIAYEKFDASAEKDHPTVSTSSVTIHGDGVVGGRDVNTGPVTFGD